MNLHGFLQSIGEEVDDSEEGMFFFFFFVVVVVVGKERTNERRILPPLLPGYPLGESGLHRLSRNNSRHKHSGRRLYRPSIADTAFFFAREGHYGGWYV